LVVWFYKPLVPPAAGGAYPPITEVLTSSAIDGLVKSDSANAGRFKILHDKTYYIGCSIYGKDAAATPAVTSISQNGTMQLDWNRKIIVDKTMYFKEAPTDTNKGGHYDTAADAGQITRGMLVVYMWMNGDAGTCTNGCTSRLTYVG